MTLTVPSLCVVLVRRPVKSLLCLYVVSGLPSTSDLELRLDFDRYAAWR